MGGSTLGREEAIFAAAKQDTSHHPWSYLQFVKSEKHRHVDIKRKYYGRSNYEELEEV